MRNSQTLAAVHVPGETYTPHEYAMASEALTRIGWTCTGGIYPNSTAEAGEPVRWQGRFERVINGKTERFCLTPKTIGTPEFQSAAAFAPSASVEKELRRDLAGMEREAARLRSAAQPCVYCGQLDCPTPSDCPERRKHIAEDAKPC